MISLPKCMGIYTKLKLVHGPLNVHHSCTPLLSFIFKNNFLNFVNNLEKNISWNVAKTIARWEISLINLEPRFPEMYSTAYNLVFKGDSNWGTITVHWIRACSAVALNRVEDHERGKMIYLWRDHYGDHYKKASRFRTRGESEESITCRPTEGSSLVLKQGHKSRTGLSHTTHGEISFKFRGRNRMQTGQ